ncbi:MAG: SH3 domain-containing protein, partial [archaeon]|nr:SH3 domain-containing protein [archaeon]
LAADPGFAHCEVIDAARLRIESHRLIASIQEYLTSPTASSQHTPSLRAYPVAPDPFLDPSIASLLRGDASPSSEQQQEEDQHQQSGSGVPDLAGAGDKLVEEQPIKGVHPCSDEPEHLSFDSEFGESELEESELEESEFGEEEDDELEDETSWSDPEPDPEWQRDPYISDSGSSASASPPQQLATQSAQPRVFVPRQAHAQEDPPQKCVMPGEPPHVVAIIRNDVYEYRGAPRPVLRRGDTVRIDGGFSDSWLQDPRIEYLVNATADNSSRPISVYVAGRQLRFTTIVNHSPRPQMIVEYPMWDRQANGEDELPLRRSAPCTLFDPSPTDPGWCYAVADLSVGLAPLNFFRPLPSATPVTQQGSMAGAPRSLSNKSSKKDRISPSSSSSSSSPSSSSPSSFPSSSSSVHDHRTDDSWDFPTTTVFALPEWAPPAHPQTGQEQTDQETCSQPEQSWSKPEEKHRPQPTRMCRAKFSYRALASDELSFVANEAIMIFGEGPDPGWWIGASMRNPPFKALVPETHIQW